MRSPCKSPSGPHLGVYKPSCFYRGGSRLGLGDVKELAQAHTARKSPREASALGPSLALASPSDRGGFLPSPEKASRKRGGRPGPRLPTPLQEIKQPTLLRFPSSDRLAGCSLLEAGREASKQRGLCEAPRPPLPVLQAEGTLENVKVQPAQGAGGHRPAGLLC